MQILPCLANQSGGPMIAQLFQFPARRLTQRAVVGQHRKLAAVDAETRVAWFHQWLRFPQFGHRGRALVTFAARWALRLERLAHPMPRRSLGVTLPSLHLAI